MVKIKKIDETESYIHVRFRQPSRFNRVRTPDWAANVADSVSKDAEVRMGRTDAGNWFTQSVLLKPQGIRDMNHARSLARRIQKKIDE